MRKILERIDDEPSLIHPGSAVGAALNMGLQGCNPEAHLVIEEQVDLVWKQVPVIHGVSEGGLRRVVTNGFRTVERWNGGAVEPWVERSLSLAVKCSLTLAVECCAV